MHASVAVDFDRAPCHVLADPFDSRRVAENLNVVRAIALDGKEIV